MRFTYEGTDHIHTLIVGQDITGLATFEQGSGPASQK
jgi:hypothetical protein